MIACLLAIASGLLYFLAFPSLDLWPLTFVAFVPLLCAVDRCAKNALQAVGLGLLAGAVAQLLGFRWLVATLRVFSALPLWGSLLAYASVCIYQAGQQALFALLLYGAKRHARGAALTLIAPFCYVAVESVYPMLFPSHLAATLHTVPLLLQLLDLGGPSLIALLLLAVNAAFYGTLAPSARRVRTLGVAAFVIASMFGYGILRGKYVATLAARAPALSVGIVQTNMERLEKREARAEGRRRHIEQSQQLELGLSRPAHGSRAPDLLVWPETALQYVLPTEQKNVHALLGPLTTPVLFGGLGHRIEHGQAQLFNSAFLADEEGLVLGRTDKIRLIPFAEFIPFGDYVPRLYDWLPNSGQFTPGDRAHVLPFRDHRIAALICYEDVLPDAVREVMQQTDAQLLVNMSNDAWFGRSDEPYIHLALSKLRAIEQRRYLVRASNSGVSAIIDPLGHVVVQSATFTRASLRGRVTLLSTKTWYRAIGDWPGWLSLLVALYAALPLGKRRGRQ